jgi:hypothetical protein
MQAAASSPTSTNSVARFNRGLMISRIAFLLYVLAIVSAIMRHEPREMLIGIIIAVIPVFAGPRPYRILGAVAAAVTFLTTALIQMS